MPTAAKKTGSQFDGLLAARKKTSGGSEPAGQGSAQPRPLAKSKDPEWRATSLYLKKDTVRDTDYRLKVLQDGRDVSELVEDLMTEWLAANAKR